MTVHTLWSVYGDDVEENLADVEWLRTTGRS